MPRPASAAGSIVATKGGEELRFVREERWRPAEVKQDVIGGDVLRTNAIGNLAILFADQTQIRVGRNSTLTVNDVAGANNATTHLDLQSGNLWARAARGGTGVDVKTPAAVAAIRGTDWSLTVDASGKTALVVLEGTVELKNAQGAVTVRQGEGAVAAIGQAPTKFVLVNSDDREQMLFYLTLRDVFTSISLSPLTGPALRAERARIEAIPAERRKVEDWLSLAEIASYFDGRAVAAKALAEARRLSLNPTQRARADVVEGTLAGAQRRWREAATLFAGAERGGLDSKRRINAAYGRYIAQSLADPKRVYPEPPLDPREPEAALAHAYIVAFREDLNAASKVIKAAEKRFPNNARIAVLSAQLALALNRREEMRAAIERARRIDPDDPNVILTYGSIKADIDGEVEGGLAELRRATIVAPGNTDLWNGIGLFESSKDRTLAAEEAFRRAIAEDPESPVPYANLAILLLDQSRVDEAGALIDKALAIDPAFSVGSIALGRYLLQKGETAKGLEAILAGSTANPAYSQGLLLTAIAYYQNGDVELADQALDNADRLDPNDPVVSVTRTAIALDQYQADQAIVSAREAVRRYRQRGGDFAGLAVNREAGSYPAQAYRFLNLDEWARYYGDRVFDPFTASSYFDEAAARRPSIFATRPTISSAQGDDIDLTTYTLMIQGLFFDPLAVSSRIGRVDLLRRPFIDTEFGGSVLVRNNRIGWEADASVQGFSNEPVPTSFSLSAARALFDGDTSLDRENASNASFFIGTAPSAADRFLIFGAASSVEPGLAKFDTRTRFFAGTQDLTSMQAGAGWSHSFGDRNVLTGAVYATRGIDRRYSNAVSADLFPLFVSAEQWQRNRNEGLVAALGHTLGFGDFTVRYGIEGQTGRTLGWTSGTSRTYNAATGAFDSNVIDERPDSTFQAARLFADAFWRPSDRFEIQAGVEGDFVDIESRPSENSIAPRIGIGVSPLDGQWLRAAYRRDGLLPLNFTLSPVTTVGLVPNNLPISLGGRTDTMALRWDAEWSPHVFTAVEYQRQDVRGLDIPVVNTFDSIAIEKGHIERLSATANVWLGHGFGVFGTVGTLSSDVRSGDTLGADIPFLSGRFARAGITFADPSRLKIAVAATFVGDRKGNLAGLKLDDYWTADASITWETPDRRLLLGLTFLNLLDQDYELAPGIRGTGRTFAATMKARF
ncbi:FecR domain-containing protein [Microvirga alba]|uniref:FecR domain-containing protein n=1 Tax=Microvirga alba TaxID=2791025 RepID=A0A931BPG5_9HYPH|nr:FecR domain-containing protein [Microvirga alba]MBF9232920.1 FecR domain-containing protein [Microvirga alba]